MINVESVFIVMNVSVSFRYGRMRIVKKAIVKIYWDDNGVEVIEQKIAKNMEELEEIVDKTKSWQSFQEQH